MRKTSKKALNCIFEFLKNNLLELPNSNLIDIEDFINKNLDKIKIIIAIRTIDLLLGYKKFYFDDIDYLLKFYRNSNKKIKNKILKQILLNKTPFINFAIANNIVKNYIKNNELNWIFNNYIYNQLKRNRNFVFNENKMLISLKSIFANYFYTYDYIDKNNDYIKAINNVIDFIINKIAYKIITNKKNINIIFGINKIKNKNQNLNITNIENNEFDNFKIKYKNYLNKIFKLALVNNLFSNLINEYNVENYEIYEDIKNEILEKEFDNINQLNKALFNVFNKYYKNLNQIDIIDFVRDTIKEFEEIIIGFNNNKQIIFETMEIGNYNILKDDIQNKILIFTIIGNNNANYKINDIIKFQKAIFEDLIKYENYNEITKYSLGDVLKNVEQLINFMKI